MCGLAGFFDPRGLASDDAARLAVAMADAIRHRGPDDAGAWVDGDGGIAFAHRRLTVLDLSPAGKQPMHSASGRYVMVFNGEIYNHLELRHTLPGGQAGLREWRGHSDTETLLAAFEAWGVEETLRQSAGMFALALWDRRRRTLTLARDRLGEKPLYYGRQGGVFLFASELKALRLHPAFTNQLDRRVLASYLRYNYVPAPGSIYQGIGKLPPGTFLELDSAAAGDEEPVAYWSLRDACATGQRELFCGDAREAGDRLEDLLGRAVEGQMVADVPLGAFLSGGIDSSTVVAIMQSRSTRPVKSFTLGFHDENYDEAAQAAAVARHLGTEHTEFYVTASDAMNVIPELPGIWDEPFADSSQIPTLLVSRLARRRVTVALSGDGGDELFGGYNRYLQGERWWRRFSRLPLPVRRILSGLCSGLSDRMVTRLAATLVSRRRIPMFSLKFRKLAEVMACESGMLYYRKLVSQWERPEEVVIDGDEPGMAGCPESAGSTGLEPGSRPWMMFMDLISYLPDDILVKMDRAAMSVGLETRVPLLDHRLVEFAWRLPLDMKIREGQGKWLLRQVLYKYVPRELVEKPKMGFGVPLDIWLRGPLRDWAEDLLAEERLRREGFLRPAPIRRKWQEHLVGHRNWAYHLWGVLMFQAWLSKVDFVGSRCP